MKRKTSTSHNEAIIRRLRKDPKFATEYLKAALEDESCILLITLRHLARRKASPKSPRPPFSRLFRDVSYRRWLPPLLSRRRHSPDRTQN